MSDVIDKEIDNASHDFDPIKQSGCEYGKEKVLNIDVDKIIGLKGDSKVNIRKYYFLQYIILQFGEILASVASELEFSEKSIEDVKLEVEKKNKE